MMDFRVIESGITALLSKHECVVIPEFGAFLLRHAPASANQFSGEIRPAAETVFFNPGITADDGLLASYIRTENGTDYAGALAMLASYRQHVQSFLDEHRNYPLLQLGNFFRNAEGKLLFLPLSGVNLDKKGFGLTPITLLEAAPTRTAPVAKVQELVSEPVAEPAATRTWVTEPAVAPAEEADVIAVSHEIKTNRGIWWKAAATVCMISLSAVAVYYGKSLLKMNGRKQVASTTVVAPQAEPAIEKKSVDTVYREATKDINEENLLLKTRKGAVFVCGGSYMNMQLAKNECATWHKLGVPAVIGRKPGSSLVKVVLGRFKTEVEASDYLQQLPGNTGFHAGTLIANIQFED